MVVLYGDVTVLLGQECFLRFLGRGHVMVCRTWRTSSRCLRVVTHFSIVTSGLTSMCNEFRAGSNCCMRNVGVNNYY
jgi:hypothetical protein